MTERVDRLTAPVEVGKFYLVPVVTAKWNNHLAAWPVIGPLHTDSEFFNFTADHYHIDGRFLSKPLRKVTHETIWYYSTASHIQAAPLHAYHDAPPLPKPVLARRRCVSVGLSYEHGEQKPVQQLRAHFTGAQCERGKGGWICPHRKASLGSILPADGVITCPLHGLRIDAATGVVLPRPTSLNPGDEMSIADRIMYVCSQCADDNPEGCGHYNPADLIVMPDGRWLCNGCFDDMPLDERGGDKCWSDFPSPPEHRPRSNREAPHE